MLSGFLVMKVMSLILHSNITVKCICVELNRMYSRISEERACKLFEVKHNDINIPVVKIDACIIMYLEFTLQIEVIL